MTTASPPSLRPSFHFAAPPGTWINDPVPFYDDISGRMHVFLQHNPNAPIWADMHWLHISSLDLSNWENHGIALAPSRTPGEPDVQGVWTGCIFRRPVDGKYIALYTSVSSLAPIQQTQCAALSDDLMHWEKYSNQPLKGLSERPEGFGECFRDPQVFTVPDGTWYCLIGGEQLDGKGGVAFLYRAVDDSLLNWQYEHLLFAGGSETGNDFECPDLFPLSNSDRWCLITSRGKSFWHVGTLDTETMRFSREAWGECDNGLFYAAKSCTGPHNARWLWGWLREDRAEVEQRGAEWSGLLSVPRQVEGNPDFPFPEFSPVVMPTQHTEPSIPEQETATVSPEQTILVTEFRAPALIRIETVESESGDEGSAELLLMWDSRSQLSIPIPDVNEECYLYWDRSVIEVFLNGETQTYRIYPGNPESLEVYLRGTAESGAITVQWQAVQI